MFRKNEAREITEPLGWNRTEDRYDTLRSELLALRESSMYTPGGLVACSSGIFTFCMVIGFLHSLLDTGIRN